MSNENALWEDMRKLNALYEELCWGHEDELQFTHEEGRVVIYNKTQEKKNVQWQSRKTEWSCSNDRFRCSSGILLHYWTSNPRCVVNDVLILAMSFLGGFILMSVLSDRNIDDDDDMDGGMMIPAYNPVQ